MIVQIEPTSIEQFQNLLIEIPYFKNRSYDLPYCNQQLKEAILAFGSETPDNLEAARHIVYGSNSAKLEWGLKLKNTPFLISELIQALLNSYPPKNIKHYFPDLTLEEWQEAMKFSYLLLKDIEKPKGLIFRMKEVYKAGQNGRLTTALLQNINLQTQDLLNSIYPKNNLSLILFGKEKAPYERWGVQVKNYVFLSDLFNEFESADNLPDVVKNTFAISKSQWDAVLRMVTLILVAFEGN